MASVPVYIAQGKVGCQDEIAYGGTTFTGVNPHLVDPYTDVPQLTSITLGDLETEEVELTHLKSPNRRREFQPGFSDCGTAEAEGTARWEAGVLNAAQKFILNEGRSGHKEKRWFRVRIYENVNTAPTLFQTIYFVGYVSAATPGPFTTNDPEGFRFSIRTAGDEVWDPALV